MNFDRLRFVAERAEVGEAREALFGVTIPERPGAFREFCATIGRRVVTEFNYRLNGRNRAHIFVGYRDAVAGGRRRPGRDTAGARLRDGGADRQRGGQAARPPHGRRAERRRPPRAAVPLRVSGAARARSSRSSKRSAAAGTSACSTTATTAPTSAASWPASKCRRTRWAASKSFSIPLATSTSGRTPTPHTGCSLHSH